MPKVLEGGFIPGITQGARLALDIDKFRRDRNREPIEQAQRDETHDLNMRLRSMQVEDYLDGKKRADAKQKLTSGLVALEAGDVNNSDALEAINIAFKKDIQNGVGDDIVSKRVERILPSPDGKGFMLGLEITRKDGTKYSAPMTMNRSSDKNDKVTVIRGEDGIRQVMTTKQIIDRMEASAAQYGDEWLKERFETRKSDRAHKNRLEEIDAVERARKKHGTSGTTSVSADMQYVDRLVKSGLSEREALEYVSKLKTREGGHTKQLRTSLFTQLVKARDQQLLQQGDPGYRSDMDIWKMTSNMVDGESESGDLSLTRKFPVGQGVGKGTFFTGGQQQSGPAAGLTRFGPVTSEAAGAPQPPAAPAALNAAGTVAPVAQPQEAAPPPEAFAGLEEGKQRRFRNGQVWTIKGGQPVRVQ